MENTECWSKRLWDEESDRALFQLQDSYLLAIYIYSTKNKLKVAVRINGDHSNS